APPGVGSGSGRGPGSRSGTTRPCSRPPPARPRRRRTPRPPRPRRVSARPPVRPPARRPGGVSARPARVPGRTPAPHRGSRGSRGRGTPGPRRSAHRRPAPAPVRAPARRPTPVGSPPRRAACGSPAAPAPGRAGRPPIGSRAPPAAGGVASSWVRACRKPHPFPHPLGDTGGMGFRSRRLARPEVTVANYEAVYDFFGPGRRRDGFTYPLLRLIDAIYRPRVRISAETVAELRRLHRAGVGVLVAVNHPSTQDPLVLAATLFDKRI